MNDQESRHSQLIERVAQRYQQDGYEVYREPESQQLPFDLGLYHPDLLVKNAENHGYIIEVKNTSSYTSVDRLREIAETVAQHDGWRFLLITGDDVFQQDSEQNHIGTLLSWDQILSRKKRAETLLKINEWEGAFLIFWGIFEAILRRQAQEDAIPVEHFPTSSLIKHLYSQGQLSLDQFEQAMQCLKVRNQFLHGFQTAPLDETIVDLSQLVSDLFLLWHPSPLQ